MIARFAAAFALALLLTAAQAQPPPPPPPPSIVPAPTNVMVFFDPAGTALDAGDRTILEMLLDSFRRGWARRVALSGHADAAGSAGANLAFSRRRALAVRDYLVANGVPAGAIEMRWFGETRLLVATPDGAAEPQNRRVYLDFGENPAFR